jgi:hypothetical protein
LKLKLTLLSSLNLGSASRKLGLLLLGLSQRSLLLFLLFFLAKLALSDLLLKGVKTSLSRFLLLGKLVFLILGIAPENELSVVVIEILCLQHLL